jgi:hypothetical protein
VALEQVLVVVLILVVAHLVLMELLVQGELALVTEEPLQLGLAVQLLQLLVVLVHHTVLVAAVAVVRLMH